MNELGDIDLFAPIELGSLKKVISPTKPVADIVENVVPQHGAGFVVAEERDGLGRTRVGGTLTSNFAEPTKAEIIQPGRQFSMLWQNPNFGC